MPLQATSGAASQDAFGGNGVAVVPTYIEDVFSCFLYTGTGASQTITNNIDLSTNGGLTWIKGRSGATGHRLTDTARGVTKSLASNSDAAQATETTGLTSFGTTGFTIGADADYNTSAATYASWTFRKQPKFFDIVTYSGDNSVSRQISHNLGSTPGCIMVKATNNALDWYVQHRSLATTNAQLILNTTDASAGASNWGNAGGVAPTSTVFTVGDNANASGYTYVAYLFAHNAGGFGLTGTDNVISCGSFTTNGSGAATVSLGYEPQWVLFKASSRVLNWSIHDTMRGMPVGSVASGLYPNLSDAESNNVTTSPTSTGFTWSGYANETFIYVAIRRGPMKVPTTGTSVYENTAYTGNNTAQRKIGSSVLTDLLLLSNRDATSQDWSTYAQYVFDRLRGQDRSLATTATASETNSWNTYFNLDMNTGWDTASAVQDYLNKTSATYVSNAFRRAPSFMDVVCYTGTGSARTVSHNLAAVPELLIIKSRSQVVDWNVWSKSGTQRNDYKASLNGAGDYGSTGGDLVWGTPASSAPSMTSTTFSLGDYIGVNNSGSTYVAYLFATCAGVSKVFSYTGNGSSQTIDCGFTAGARFVLIKRINSSGNWYVWDTARGIVSGNDPYLLLNSTAAEVTTDDTIDTDNTGFVVNQVTATNVNVSSATYLGLAIA